MFKLGEHTLRDIDVDSLVKSIGYSTAAGAKELTGRLSLPITDIPEMLHRQNELRQIRKKCQIHTKEITQILLELHNLEEDTVSIANASTDSRLNEYYTQIVWPKESFFGFLNNFSILTEGIIFLRTILLPGCSILLPALIIASPFILYFMMGKEMTLSSYMNVLSQTMKKAVPSVLGAPRFKGKGDAFELGEQIVQIGVSFAMLVVNVWNQISSAIHMRKVVSDMRRRAESALKFTEATQRLSAILEISGPTITWKKETMSLFGIAWMNPDSIHSIIQHAGHLDMLSSLAMQKRICFPSYERSDSFYLKDVYHPGITPENRMYNTIQLGGEEKTHVLLTGPNRGGKSTLLKSLGTAVLMSQTVGIAFARAANIPVFQTIITALNPTDSIGKMSLFEAEIEFAKSVRDSIKEGCPMFLMMDEIFHGTNAHDGVEASQIFLDSLYTHSSSKNIYSVISTHYMELPNKYGKTYSQNLCMDASVDPIDPDRLQYSYKLMSGINKYSSVREILFERGLITKKTTKTADKE
jgi:hypothetical protein